ncbi:MAG TPA: hypothetical protein VFS00_02900 [Polyangiaceae bacterium]|nr:hypothetical protein [Polyangiaceae bacterium]
MGARRTLAPIAWAAAWAAFGLACGAPSPGAPAPAPSTRPTPAPARSEGPPAASAAPSASAAGAAGAAPNAAAGEATTPGGGAGGAAERWCAPELQTLAGEICVFVPSREMAGPRTLVIFLHGIVEPGSAWQWSQQRAASRAAQAQGFAVLMPRGLRGPGPKGVGRHNVWAWPGSPSAETEAELIASWQRARAELEARDGRPFERVWVFGFSSGAYYAASLALRGRLAGPDAPRADGFAAFAGGGGASKAVETSARRTKERAPIFVGWGGKDPSRNDPSKLAAMLRRLGWPAKGEASPKAGHEMTDGQVANAVRFLSAPLPGGAKGRPAKR